MFCRSFSIPALFVLLSACAAKTPGPSAIETDYRLKMAEADSSFDNGCFVCLTDAFEGYQALVSHPLDDGTAGEKLFQTSLVLALREKELGIPNGRYQDLTSTLLPHPPSAYLSLCLEIVDSTFSTTRGLDDERLEEHFAGLGERAWNCAISASQHDYFKDKANDLIVKIQETIKH